jgi:molybdate transport system regulatory protein
MNISARNQFAGKVEAIEEGAVNAVVTLKTNAGSPVVATISMAAVKELGLVVGKAATAIIKATEVMVAIGDLKISARNQFDGEVVSVTAGAVNAIVAIKIAGGNIISATISMAAVKELGLAAGVKAKAIVKASSVLVAV